MSNNPHETLPQSNATVTEDDVLSLATVVCLSIAIILMLFVYLNAKRKLGSTPSNSSTTRIQVTIVSSQTRITSSGLDAEILKSLPVTVYKASELKESQECAVCLSEIKNGEEVSMLPKCNHGFHLKCIDMWFHSHSTCPLCRAPITKELALETGSSGICRSQEGSIAIDIPMREVILECVESPLPVSKFAEEEVRGTSLTRLGTFTRLWSKGKMVIGACSPRGADVENGAVGEGSNSTLKN